MANGVLFAVHRRRFLRVLREQLEVERASGGHRARYDKLDEIASRRCHQLILVGSESHLDAGPS